jgi:PhoPQ-activated pathogenicity-related protein
MRDEDEIIAYSYDKFLDHVGEPGNETWPVLVAMAKSAVRAMDAVQLRDTSLPGAVDVQDFIVTGFSKRGWTTWLTAASDDRVRAIIPGVFDNLNQGPQMVHHFQVYGQFAEAVHDYNDMEIFQRMQTPEAQLLGQIVDPYRHLDNGRFEIPSWLSIRPATSFSCPIRRNTISTTCRAT